MRLGPMRGVPRRLVVAPSRRLRHHPLTLDLRHRSTASASASETPPPPLDDATLAELKYLEEPELRQHHESMPKPPPWADYKAAVDAAATPVDARVRPIYATLTLSFVSQGIQFPVLPQLARSLELSVADLGLVTATTAAARLLSNAPATAAAERIGRRPLLMIGPAAAGVGMAALAASTSFSHMVCANVCVGVGLATTMAGAQLYLADVSTPRNRAQSTAPILQSALIGYALGPAAGGLMAQSLGLTLPFVVCAGGLFASAGASFMILPETVHEAARRTAEQQRRQVEQQQRRQSMAMEVDEDEPTSSGDANAATTTTGNSSEMTWRLLGRPALQGVGAIVFMNGFTQGAMPVTLVLFAVEHMHMDSASVGAMLTANVTCMVLATRPATRLSDNVSSRKSIMLPAITAAAIANGLQPFSDGPWVFAALVGAGGLAQAVALPSISPLILDSVTNEERPTALAGRQMSQDLGALIGAASMGFVGQSIGIPAAMMTVAVMQLASAGVFWMRVPHVSRPVS